MDSFESKVSVDRLQDAGEILGVLGDAFGSVSMFDEEHEKRRVQTILMLGYVHMVVNDLALHLAEGNEIHDALRAVVRGDRELDADVAKVFQKAVEDSRNPMKKN